MKTIPMPRRLKLILALASTAVTFAAADTTALAQGPDRKLRTDAEVQAANDGYIDTLKAGEYKDSKFFKCFRTSDQIFEYVNKLTIYAYKLTDGASKPKSLYFQSLLHAREWVAGSSNLYALASILDGIANTQQTAAELFNLYFVPIVNIDGYDISWTKGKRLQRKNANEVDLNRNWPARFDHPENDKDPTNETYHGTGALSEPETTGIDEWLKKKKSSVVWTCIPSRGRSCQTAGSFGVAIGAFDDYIYRTYKKPVLTIEVAGSKFVVPASTIRTRGEEVFKALTHSQFADEVLTFEGNEGGIVFPEE
ncbi:hypothetical protein H257_19310 [Aphanomyces astaci]|uniref:Peptidase M14 domain-containing protein n=1 Tax=Aphanomyces astaci TaxID=112090 RepID=W4FA12_APHAT|nr:hypothetical protein H257_19310 [Aphanomyces astaci]ETV63759.1 hypothetical protein H257_19310 [Aphanomyces astaci]|eukprot:XP_009846757.1 hypothetical protein H257_19310 [Aphanomyces astaci]